MSDRADVASETIVVRYIESHNRGEQADVSRSAWRLKGIYPLP